jgi:hypothetical protein
MAPKRPSPLSITFAKTPFLNCFFSHMVPNWKSGTAEPGLAPEQGSRTGAGHAPPPAGRGRSTSRGGGALQERRRGQAPPPAVPHLAAPSPTLAAPPLSGAPSSRAGAPLAVGGLQRRCSAVRRSALHRCSTRSLPPSDSESWTV